MRGLRHISNLSHVGSTVAFCILQSQPPKKHARWPGFEEMTFVPVACFVAALSDRVVVALDASGSVWEVKEREGKGLEDGVPRAGPAEIG